MGTRAFWVSLAHPLSNTNVKQLLAHHATNHRRSHERCLNIVKLSDDNNDERSTGAKLYASGKGSDEDLMMDARRTDVL